MKQQQAPITLSQHTTPQSDKPADPGTVLLNYSAAFGPALPYHWQFITEGVVSMIEIYGLDHVVLRTSHMEEMLHFYGTILGCPVERELPPEFGLVQLRAGSALIDLVAVDSELGRAGGGPPTERDNNMDHFCLQVNTQPEEEISRYLASHGIEAAPFERRYGAQGYGNSVYLRDPDGNIVELRNRI